jgi:hypothetical protein
MDELCNTFPTTEEGRHAARREFWGSLDKWTLRRATHDVLNRLGPYRLGVLFHSAASAVPPEVAGGPPLPDCGVKISHEGVQTSCGRMDKKSPAQGSGRGKGSRDQRG